MVMARAGHDGRLTAIQCHSVVPSSLSAAVVLFSPRRYAKTSLVTA